MDGCDDGEVDLGQPVDVASRVRTSLDLLLAPSERTFHGAMAGSGIRRSGSLDTFSVPRVTHQSRLRPLPTVTTAERCPPTKREALAIAQTSPVFSALPSG